ncbi:MAG: hypothetical protein RJA70_3669 [Pseudomonadota bacterium]
MKVLSLIALILLLGGSACSHFTRVEASTDGQSEFKIIELGPLVVYLLDPRTESCVLVYAQTAATTVDCATLARNLPEAREFLTWVPREAVTAGAPESETEKLADAEQESPSPDEATKAKSEK